MGIAGKGKKPSAQRVSTAAPGAGAKAHGWKSLQPAGGLAVNDRAYAVPAGALALPARDPKKEGCLLADNDELVLGINGPGSGDELAAALKKATGKEFFTLNGGPWGATSTADPNKPLWMVAVEEAAAKRTVKLTISLDGLEKADGTRFESAEEALRYTVARGRTYTTPQLARQRGNQTAWELATIVKAAVLNETRDLKDITWYWKGQKMNTPPDFDWRATFSIDK
ncbi:polymorphic toxin type 27 domain-containing protein [Streptomyces sp. NPDC058619]|uniref:polymorphic toxin type 27 domain-containing protein n=1 Tax=unclassified Streptomyces TaxID=2593676 RepID=UPI00365EA12D